MSRVPDPQQGQPLDLSYIRTITDAVNQISRDTAELAQGNNFIFQGGLTSTPATYKMYGAQIFAKEISVDGGTTDSPEQIVSFSPYNFASPPVVTATLVAPSNREAVVSLKQITSSSVTVVVKFPTSEGNSTRVSILAMGVPSNSS